MQNHENLDATMTLIHFATPRGLHLTIWYDWSCQGPLVGKHQQQNQANTHDIQNCYLPTYPQHNHTPKRCGSLAVVSEKFVAAVEHETTLKSANQTITHIVLPSSPMHSKNQIVFFWIPYLKKRECKRNFPPMGHSKVVIFRKLPTSTEPPLPVLWFALAGGFIATNRGQTHETRVYWCCEKPLFKDRSRSKFFTFT